MRRMRARSLLSRPVVCFAAGVLVVALRGASPSGADLCYSGGGYWRLRLTVEVRNEGSGAVDGAVVALPVSRDDATRELIGRRPGELRAADAAGHELLLGVENARGYAKHAGRIEAGDRVFLPVEVAGGKSVQLYIFADNPAAWTPPEWLRQTRPVNLSFEELTPEGVPAGWSPWGVDDQHEMAVQEGGAHAGRRCARCVVAPGAAPTWVKYWQGGIPVSAGEKYRFSAWVKADAVQGRAGWYVHVDGEKQLMVNKVEGAGGSFGWRKVSIEFEVPEGGRLLSFGTVLYGTGTAWYDDVQVERISGGPRLTARVVSARRTELRRIGVRAPWPDLPRWNWRVPIVVRNFSGQPRSSALIQVDLHRALNAAFKQFGFGWKPVFRLTDPENARKPLAVDLSEDGMTLRFTGALPASSEKTFRLYMSRRGDAPGQSPAMARGAMFAGANLAPNPDMEEGEGPTPAAWNAGEEGRAGRRFRARRVQPGHTGNWRLELTVPQSIENPGWCGWRQKVPVKAGGTYLLGGWVRTRGVDGPVRIHGHFLRKDGSLTARPFFSTTPSVTGDSDWTWTSTTVTTPPDCAFIEVHLTMNCHGTVWHDGVVLAQVAAGRTGAFEARRGAARKFSWWVVNPRVKVFPGDLPPEDRPAKVRVAACRNARRAFQVAFRSKSAVRLSFRVSGLRGPRNAGLAPPALWAVRYVPVDFPVGYDSNTEPAWYRHHPRHRGNDGWSGLWPDPLSPLPDGVLDLEAGVTHAVLGEVSVPADAVPGDYSGDLTVTVGKRSVRIPIVVRVWRMVLPEERRLPALYDLRNGPGRKAFVSSDPRSVETWYRFLAKYNVSPSFVYPPPVFRYRDGRVEMDASGFDRAAHLLFDELHVPRVYTPNFFYACGWAYPPRKVFGLEPFSGEYVKAWKEAYRLFVEHITQKGWRKRFVFYISDEPDGRSEVTIRGIARIADMAREIAPDIPVYSSTWRYIEGLAGHITLWGMGPQGSFAPDKVAERRKAGDHFWYTTDGQMCLDTPYLGIEYLLPWFCHKYGAEAYEFWGVSWWTWNPWEYGWHSYIRQSHEGKVFRWVRYPNGDGFLAYPPQGSDAVTPLPSIRLVAAREGVDDYELLLGLERLAAQGDDKAGRLLGKVHALVQSPNRGGRWSTVVMPDPDAVERLREKIGDFLDRRAGGRKSRKRR